MGQDDAAQGYGNGEGGGDESRARRMRVIAIATGVALFVLIVGAVGVYAYDASRNDEIADGIRVGSVDVGGLSQDEAKRLLRHDLVQPLREPVLVKAAGRTFKLPPRKLRVQADLEGMVDDAIEASQEGGLFGRTYRYVTGGTVDERIEPDVSYSRQAVNRFVEHVAGETDRDPQDASVSPTGTSLNVVPAENGRSVKQDKLYRRIDGLLDKAARYRTVRAGIRITKPEVSTKEVASQYPTYITVDRYSYSARLWKDLKLVKTYTIAVGQPAYPTPSGLYSIQSKQVDPVWSVPNSPWAGELAGTTVAGGTAENPLRERWMGVTTGVGFHGTDDTYSLGTAASHGCLRMSVPDVIELYDQVEVGTPVYIG
jgi:lipoprotein-anchoring transpeptidase ErfK/SrfK